MFSLIMSSIFLTYIWTKRISGGLAPVSFAAASMRFSMGRVMVSMNSKSWEDRYLKVCASMLFNIWASFTFSFLKWEQQLNLLIKTP